MAKAMDGRHKSIQQKPTQHTVMAKLPQITIDPTLHAVDRALEKNQDRSMRSYLGFSALGKPCERALWYAFRQAKAAEFNADTLKRFADGHAGEDVQAARLRLVDGITLMTHDANTGEQYGFAACGGHAKGHMDGAIQGLLQAPITWHVWEHKQVDQAKFNKLNKLKTEVGEKQAMQAWDEIYYAQAVLYLHLSGMTRHYLTCATPGGRETTSVRTNADPAFAQQLLAKAERVITAAEPPPGISDDPEWFQCKWCDYKAVCHQTALPLPGCRSCCHATPELDGDARWSCVRHQKDLSLAEQKDGCAGHLYIPALLNNFARVEDSSESENWVEYIHKETGKPFKNGTIPDAFLSAELHAVEDKSALTDDTVQALRAGLQARLVA